MINGFVFLFPRMVMSAISTNALLLVSVLIVTVSGKEFLPDGVAGASALSQARAGRLSRTDQDAIESFRRCRTRVVEAERRSRVARLRRSNVCKRAG